MFWSKSKKDGMDDALRKYCPDCANEGKKVDGEYKVFGDFYCKKHANWYR
ncbi:hypothetical protein IC620_02660 [Hazenella sp. IB182357]|uniref:Uncharacterized protein n=1 Tax=Polycladospora coralii TaxID=2771432 RepID=A0A926N506_9BACL|nr:hypothetical protein [Polycladospora coralii]MBD1371254.1 hypothetical protein [Polycladospora coralii]MBS7530196.1 hypothetical protein [Polycladospora coralii]MBS7530208.1 hypothetical protein [Polycladospora coralii]